MEVGPPTARGTRQQRRQSGQEADTEAAENKEDAEMEPKVNLSAEITRLQKLQSALVLPEDQTFHAALQEKIDAYKKQVTATNRSNPSRRTSSERRTR